MQRLRIPIWDRFTRLKNFKSFTIVQSQCTIVKKNRLVECNSKIGIGDLRPRNLDLNTWPCCRHLLSFAYSLLLFVFTICNAWFAFWSLLLQFTTIDSDYLEHHLTVLHTAVKGLFTYYVSRRRGGRGYGKCWPLLTKGGGGVKVECWPLLTEKCLKKGDYRYWECG